MGPDRQSAARRREGYEWLFGETEKREAGAEVLRLDDKICPHCGRELQAEWDEFRPPSRRSTASPASGTTILAPRVREEERAARVGVDAPRRAGRDPQGP